MPARYEHVEHSVLPDLSVQISRFSASLSHMHRDLEIAVLLDGEISVRTNDELYTASRWDILCFNAFKPHEFFALNGPASLLVIHMSKSFCSRFFQDTGALIFTYSDVSARIPPEAAAAIRTAALRLALGLLVQPQGFAFLCQASMNRIMYQLVGHFPWRLFRQEDIENTNYNDGRMQRITSYIDSHFQEPLTLQEIAAREGLSASYLSHYFRQQLHMTFRDFLNMLRFEHAVQLLTHTDRNLMNICLESGFSESKYFNRQFHARYHSAPNAFRKQLRSGGAALPEEGEGETLTAPADCLPLLRTCLPPLGLTETDLLRDL